MTQHTIPALFGSINAVDGYPTGHDFAATNLLNHAFIRALYNGVFSVQLFFVLSGFVLSRKYLATNNLVDLVELAFKRYFRFLLPIAAGLTLPYLMMHMNAFSNVHLITDFEAGSGLWMTNDPQVLNIFRLLKCIIYDAYFVGTSPFNGVLWSITAEYQGSFALVLIMVLTHSVKYRTAMLLGICMITGSPFADGILIAQVCINPSNLVRTARQALERRPRFRQAVCISSFVIAWYLASVPFTLDDRLPPMEWRPAYYTVFVMKHAFELFGTTFDTGSLYRFGSMLMILVVGEIQVARSFLSSKPLLWLGKISFMVRSEC